jgi:hypothetical protein
MPQRLLLDDNSLATELVAGRHEALTVLFKRHNPMVFRVARRILGDSGEAEEVVQQRSSKCTIVAPGRQRRRRRDPSVVESLRF